jgi:hypothetical protein
VRLGVHDAPRATQAHFNGLHGLTFDTARNFYAADYNNHRIRKVSTDGIVTTVAGTGNPGSSTCPGQRQLTDPLSGQRRLGEKGLCGRIW